MREKNNSRYYLQLYNTDKYAMRKKYFIATLVAIEYYGLVDFMYLLKLRLAQRISYD